MSDPGAEYEQRIVAGAKDEAMRAVYTARIPIPPMTSEELGTLEEKLIAWRDYYGTRETEALRIKFAVVAAHFRGASQGLNEALEMLRGNKEISQWPPNDERSKSNDEAAN